MVQFCFLDIGEFGVLFEAKSEVVNSLFIALIGKVGKTHMVMGSYQSKFRLSMGIDQDLYLFFIVPNLYHFLPCLGLTNSS